MDRTTKEAARHPGARTGRRVWESRRRQQAARQGDVGRPRRTRPPERDHRTNLASRKQFVNDEEAPREQTPCRCLAGIRRRQLFLKSVSSSGTAARPAAPESLEWEEQLNFV